jgi:hypothetical protein
MTGSDLRPCFLRPEGHIAQILPNVHDLIGKLIFPIKSWAFCILNFPYLGDVKRRGISMLPGIWAHENGEIYMNLQKFPCYVMYKRFLGCYNNRKLQCYHRYERRQ